MKKNRKGLYETQITIGGKRKVFSAKTEKALKQKIAAWQADIDHGPPFSWAAEQWRAETFPALRPSSLNSLNAAYNRAVDFFGDVRLDEITSMAIKQYIDQLAARYAAKTVSNHRYIVNQIFKYAQLHGWCSANPCDPVGIPRGLPRTKRKAASAEQVQIIRANPHGFGLLANLLLLTGLRIGEACALTWADIDLQAQTLTVSKQIIYQGNKAILQPMPKTDAGARTVIIPIALLQLLPPPGPAGTYLVSGTVTPLSRNALRLRWLAWCRIVGLAHQHQVTRSGKPAIVWQADITPHNLRHSYANTLWESKIPVELAKELMGHSDITTTQNIYLDIQRQHLSAAAALLNAHLAGTGEISSAD